MTLIFTLLAGTIAVINYVLGVYLFILFVNVALSFVKADPNNGVVRFINALCEPPCRYLLRKFPKLLLQSSGGYIDLSPMALMLGIGCVRILLEYLHNYFRYGGAGI